jgi:hypothetical protein
MTDGPSCDLCKHDVVMLIVLCLSCMGCGMVCGILIGAAL